jgi:hypothetical protein
MVRVAKFINFIQIIKFPITNFYSFFELKSMLRGLKSKTCVYGVSSKIIFGLVISYIFALELYLHDILFVLLPLQTFVNASKCKQMQANASKCKQMQANASKCKQMQANASKCKQMQANASKCKQMLANTSKC